MRMSNSACDWSRALRWFRLHGLVYDGGEITFQDDTNDEVGPDDEGIVYLGTDVASVVRRDRQYWIAYDALRQVRGTCRPSANETMDITLRSVVTGWIEDDPPPEDGDGEQIFWHSVITRSGREITGFVRRVTPAGIQMRTARQEMVSIPWAHVAAAVELLE